MTMGSGVPHFGELAIIGGAALTGLSVGVSSLVLHWRDGSAQRLEAAKLRSEVEVMRAACLRQSAQAAEDRQAAERISQAHVELLRDGRLGMPVRARALGMLRTGMSADTAAAELGLAKSEVRLLAKMGTLLAPRN